PCSCWPAGPGASALPPPTAFHTIPKAGDVYRECGRLSRPGDLWGRLRVVPDTLLRGRVAGSVGSKRACVAASNPAATLIRVGSLNAVPMKLIPTGRPKTFTIGTLM